ncbi:hypothetical protein [Desulfomonile tiedjei]|uniref:Lipocalin-like domain-containing protein n=1 Tax=Desulfomonile tiedjei (strain ATCC 49306 / DSM 6799 / DCB-1) TaxID=706587 RepID=I4C3V5_DESTA|nr:hypothetical protein [Desulfomonile tiedjei]AFM24246.1 hypothetical protein Desti_1534 [Desulfomonile tiedjei DSM 6799]
MHVILFRFAARFAILVTMALFLTACLGQSNAPQRSDQGIALAGIWDLKARVENEAENPVTQRFMRLAFNPDGTFRAEYRGDESQKWVRAGQGGFSFRPPVLNMHWDSGAISTLLVQNSDPDRMVLHHGRNMVPLAEQDPDEVFVKLKSDKGPTR